MRLGLLGCGNVAYWIHLRALRGVRGASLVAAADPDPAARERAGRVTRARLYDRPDDLLARDDIDAVVICAPTNLHAGLATAAAVAGKHVYLEKPIATSLVDAQRVIDAAGRAGVTAALGFNRRRHPLFRQARRLLGEGAIGSVRGVQAVFCEPSLPETMPGWKRRRDEGGGVLLDLASHHIDQLRWTLGDEVARVAASLRSEATEHDSATMELETVGGVQIQGFYSFRAGLSDRLTFLGERGSIRVDRHAGSLSLQVGRRSGYGTRRTWVPPSASVAAWRVGRIWRPAADPSYRRSLQEFVRAVHRNEPPGASLTDGLRSLEVVLAAEAAAGTSRHVAVERMEAGACASC